MDKEKEFVEEFALYFEQSGFQRMPGRILAWLMICEPPHQSMDQLAQQLQASKSSISTSIKHLLESGFIERVSFPGVRRDFVRIRSNFDITSLERFITRINGFSKFAERFLSLLDHLPKSRLEKLKTMRRVNQFMAEEITKGLRQWKKRSVHPDT